MGNRSETAVQRGGGHGGDHLALRRGQSRLASHDLPHEFGCVPHDLGVKAMEHRRCDGGLPGSRLSVLVDGFTSTLNGELGIDLLELAL